MTKSVFLSAITIHESWKPFFERENILNILDDIEQAIDNTYTPAAPLVLRFATTDLKKKKVMIIGKDVYPQAGVATGRCFEVNGVTNWEDKRVNSSLKNVLKLIHKSYFNHDKGCSIGKVREDIQTKQFPILPPDQAFSHWEKEGVLFLNTAFTCEVGGFEKAGSHLDVWKPFFKELLEYIVAENPDIRYFLWGDARKYSKILNRFGVHSDYLYESKHPCTNGDNGGYDKGTNFLNNPCFKETFNVIKWV